MSVWHGGCHLGLGKVGPGNSTLGPVSWGDEGGHVAGLGAMCSEISVVLILNIGFIKVHNCTVNLVLESR